MRNIALFCEQCKQPIKRRRFCSQLCARQFHHDQQYNELGEKKCGTCHQYKPCSDYHRHVKGNPAPSCKPCTLAARTRWNAEHREDINTRACRRRDDLETKFRYILYTAKSRSKQKGIEFALTVDDARKLWARQKGLCFYSGVSMRNVNGERRQHRNFSFDRIDSSRGYTSDNVVMCCEIVNRMKLDLSVDDFLRWVQCIQRNARRTRECLPSTQLFEMA